jgi:hypothetical protein
MSKQQLLCFISALIWLGVAIAYLYGEVNCKEPVLSPKLHVLNAACETLGQETSFVIALFLAVISLVLAVRGTNET